MKKYGCLAEIIKNLKGESEDGAKIESPITSISYQPDCGQKEMAQDNSLKEVSVSGIVLEFPSQHIILDYYEEAQEDYEYGIEKLLEWIEW